LHRDFQVITTVAVMFLILGLRLSVIF